VFSSDRETAPATQLETPQQKMFTVETEPDLMHKQVKISTR
jgi:hypothetical protein